MQDQPSASEKSPAEEPSGDAYTPYVLATQSPLEFSIKAGVFGVLFGICFWGGECVSGVACGTELQEPSQILDIWLFKDKTSYEKHTRDIFNQRPTTPFGFYSHVHRALVMNIATGGGALVHEIVHPFIATNFPGCPAWLNEGLGSLYEQCHAVGGRIEGLTNWRLAGLQDAIRNKQLPSFTTFCSMSDEQFYREDRGNNYGQARYLCYYLEQHRLLRRFYRRFLANYSEDPTGHNTLQEVLNRKDMATFQQDWEAYVLKLTFP